VSIAASVQHTKNIYLKSYEGRATQTDRVGEIVGKPLAIHHPELSKAEKQERTAAMLQHRSGPHIFVSVASKGLTFRVSRLESMFAGLPVSVASKRLSGKPMGRRCAFPKDAGEPNPTPGVSREV
jgi:hypothetical protein